ncbi:hypothetical protein [Jannaschia sp. LMIT008]|uniref:hypothetical protein n=1 Tax=Jannaschia maritima TaxID=3032585 RepID=UPI00281185A4|nr:hypothetical protein [Jannaschia sp. LMIT008]
MILRLPLALTLLLSLSACGFSGIGSGDSRPFGGNGLRGQSVEVGGVRFRSRLASTGPDRRGFVVTTRGAARSVVGALEAGRVRAHGHCLSRFGGTDVAWSVSPDRPVEQVRLEEGGTVTLAGTCIAR